MNLFVNIAIFTILALCTYGAVIPDVIYDNVRLSGEDGRMIGLADVDTDTGLSTSTELSPIRHRRITCDLLSFNTKVGSISSVACPLRCISQGRPGGSCKDGVCVCR